MLIIKGTTVGAVVVPQSMAYAQLATLPVEYGLYSSFMGVLVYWFFATSKDITIGVSLTRNHLSQTQNLTFAACRSHVSGHRQRRRTRPSRPSRH